MNKTQILPTGSTVSIYSPMRPNLSGRTGTIQGWYPHALTGPCYAVKIPSLDDVLPYYFNQNELTPVEPTATLEEPTEERNTMPVQMIPTGTSVIVNTPTTDMHGRTATVVGFNTFAIDAQGKRVGIYSVELPGKVHPIYLHPDELITEPRYTATVEPKVVMQAIEKVTELRRKAQEELAGAQKAVTEAQANVDKLTEQVEAFNSIIAAMSKL
jgi:hypothetical protein